MPTWSWVLLWTTLCAGALTLMIALAVHLWHRTVDLARELQCAAEKIGAVLPSAAATFPTDEAPTAPKA